MVYLICNINSYLVIYKHHLRIAATLPWEALILVLGNTVHHHIVHVR